MERVVDERRLIVDERGAKLELDDPRGVGRVGDSSRRPVVEPLRVGKWVSRWKRRPRKLHCLVDDAHEFLDSREPPTCPTALVPLKATSRCKSPVTGIRPRRLLPHKPGFPIEHSLV